MQDNVLSGLSGLSQPIDETALAPIVRQLVADDRAEVVSWTIEPLPGGYAGETVGGQGTYRLKGTASAGGQNVHWSVILKVLGRTPGLGSDDVTAWDYWKREILAYQSGLLTDLPGQFCAPRCFGVVDYPDNQFCIWLEEIVETITSWSIDDYGRAARHLGQFNGAYLAGRPVPDDPWLTKGRVRGWLGDAKPILDNLRPFLRDAKRPHWLSEAQADRVLALWASRDRLLDALDRLPRTLCHHDAFRRNLFGRRSEAGDDLTIAIDWQIVGSGAVSEEIVPLIGITLQFMNLETSKLRELEASVLEGYLAGLGDAGWQGDERMVRFGYVASAALFIGVATVGCWPSVVHESRYELAEKVIGHPVDEIIATFGAMQDHFLDLGDEAHDLIGSF